VIEFRDAPLDQGDGRRLLDEMRSEIAALYSGLDLDGPEMPRAGASELGPPHGAFLVGYDIDARAVCCGGLKRLPDGACEIKRMYVVPDARGRGIAGLLLTALEERARALGYEVARLDTGPRQPYSRRLYEHRGYRPVENFNRNPVADFFGEKSLLVAAASRHPPGDGV
jgi:GNAT superfamily N-acetyltransferase